jgi:hypothetical protein
LVTRHSKLLHVPGAVAAELDIHVPRYDVPAAVGVGVSVVPVCSMAQALARIDAARIDEM